MDRVESHGANWALGVAPVLIAAALRAAFADRATWAARTFEWVALLVVLYLMLAKPF